MSEINVGNLNVDSQLGLPVMTTAEINAVTADTPIGSVVFNSDLNKMSFYDGATWIVPKDAGSILAATGGTESTAGNFKVHAFTTAGTDSLVVTNPGTVDILIMGAGGGGGGVIGGGGGAGAFIYLPGYELDAGTYFVTVGTGGLGGNGWNSPKQYGDSGSSSGFSSIVAQGGGGGAPHGGNGGAWTSADGGSGGGAASWGGNQKAGLGAANGQVYYGGSRGPGCPGGSCFSNYGGHAGAGGGGVKTKGKDVTSNYNSSPGGDGVVSSISGVVTGYGGGGGGGNRSPGTAGLGGSGGGGNGTGTSTTAQDGAVNTGSGGGGGGYNGSSSSRIGGNGAPGVVIVRYFTGA